MSKKNILIAAVVAISLIPLSVGLAEDDLTISLNTEATCGDVIFTVDVPDGIGPFDVEIDYGDGDEPLSTEILEFPYDFLHAYPGHGSFELSIKISDIEGKEGELEQTILIEGPEVTLGSEPDPPLVILEAGEALVDFTALNGGTDPISYAWDLDGDGVLEEVDPTLNTASFTYTKKGSYTAEVTVVDECGFSDSDTLTVVVLDEDFDSDSDQACHPTAQKIADAVNSLLPGQFAQIYTCEDIFFFFRGGLTGSQLGFGRMWHAYKMATAIKELTWEDILDWKLEGSGWGLLQQLNKVADALGEVSITELMERVINGESSIKDIRTAARAALRYEADFGEALERLEGGASNGELGQFYRLTQELELDPATLDEYIASGASLSEIRHAAKLADGDGESLQTILEAHLSGNSWGEIKQAYKLATESDDPAAILEIGVHEYRRQIREEEQEERRAARDQQTAERLVEQMGVSIDQVWEAYETCDLNWGCAKKRLREQLSSVDQSDGSNRSAEHIASQYGVPLDQVWEQYSLCNQDWKCVRATFREALKGERGNGKR
jgi:PKD repeat protein